MFSNVVLDVNDTHIHKCALANGSVLLLEGAYCSECCFMLPYAVHCHHLHDLKNNLYRTVYG